MGAAGAVTQAIEWREIGELEAYARNARTHSKAQVKEIAASIKRFRWTNPILIDETNGIVAGHGRVMAAAAIYRKNEIIETVSGDALPAGKVPVIVARGWSDAEKRAYVIADNKLALNAGWNESLLRLELGDLQLIGFDLALTGFQGRELGALIGGDDPDVYSRKLAAPIYEPNGAKPKIEALCDTAKRDELVKAIMAAKLDQALEAFLMVAAERHVVFDFHAIADFYAHADAKVQRLMEASALVIVDFDRAIEGGFVTLNERLGAMASGDG